MAIEPIITRNYSTINISTAKKKFVLAGTKRAQMENVSAKRSVATHFYTENILLLNFF